MAHDFKAFGTWRFANGFVNGDGALGSFEPLVSYSGKSRVLEGMPAFRRAIFVLTVLETEGVSRIARGWDFGGGTDLLESGVRHVSLLKRLFQELYWILKDCEFSG